ncbi:CGH_1_collapsed_G0056810.mRNA.1.CDS.1 [Saccharomyces cerevisiae]|nr:CGH_1_collapsed_G0056810.mRNA.1.CDS.1 [Saccharomyces cerevisiae]
MYNSLNLNWLLNENKALQERLLSPSSTSGNDHTNNLPVIDETKEIEDISSFVNSIVDASMLTHDLTPINSSDSDNLSNGEIDRLDGRRLSSSTSDMSLMMQRTSLQKQLPSLLTAFNNARRLEQELQNACKVNDNKHSTKDTDSNIRRNEHAMSSSVSSIISQKLHISITVSSDVIVLYIHGAITIKFSYEYITTVSFLFIIGITITNAEEQYVAMVEPIAIWPQRHKTYSNKPHWVSQQCSEYFVWYRWWSGIEIL